MYRNDKGPLQPIFAFESFMKWGRITWVQSNFQHDILETNIL
jgi:hypothetical protein